MEEIPGARDYLYTLGKEVEVTWLTLYRGRPGALSRIRPMRTRGMAMS
jgi:hypothetical protein